jgi:D-serine deaminase-like pyridoxal phosphate-dependent protein
VALGLRAFLDDGVEGATLVMSRKGRIARVAVMILVGEAERLLSQGFDVAQTKPIQVENLLRAVARLRRRPSGLRVQNDRVAAIAHAS